MFTSIAFDSGAVASDHWQPPLCCRSLLGLPEAVQGNIFTDAFGIVALVAMTPVLTLLLFGVAYTLKSKATAKVVEIPATEDTIIDLQ